MTYRGALIILVVLSAVIQAAARDSKALDYAATSARFYERCQSDRTECERFVRILSQARQDAQASGMIPNRYCPPQRLNAKALTNSVLIYISATPSRKDLPLGAVAGLAFDSRFPCRQPGAVNGVLEPQL